MDSEVNETDINYLMTDSPKLLKELDDILNNVLNIEPSNQHPRCISPNHTKRWMWFQRLVRLQQHRHPDVYFQWPKDNRSSNAWSIKLYRILFYKKNRQNFVICKNCKVLLSYKSKMGVKNLLKHKCFTETLNKQLYDENNLDISFVLPSTIYPNDKQMKNQLKEFRFVRQNGILINFIYCIRCGDLFYAQRGPQFPGFIQRHTEVHSISPLSFLPGLEQLKKNLKLLIRTSDSSVKLCQIEKSSDQNCVWYLNIFRLIAFDGKLQPFFYCINCASLIPYELNEKESGLKNNETVLNHKCVRTVYRDMDFKKTETVVVPENQFTFEIKILDEENENGDENNATNISKSKTFTLPPITFVKQFVTNKLSTAKESNQPIEQNAHKELVSTPSAVVARPFTYSSSVINPSRLRNQHRKLYLKFIATNFLPIEIFKTQSFYRLTRSLIRAGKLFGKFKIQKYWLSKTSINVNLKNHVVQIKNQLHKKFKNEKLAFSCDLWENFNHKTLNVTLRSHFIDKAFNLVTIVLGTKEINSLEREEHRNNVDGWLIDCAKDILVNCLIQTPINIRRIYANSLLKRCSGFVSMHKCPITPSPLITNTLKCAATSLNEITNEILYYETDDVLHLGETVLTVLREKSLSSPESSSSTLNLKRQINNCNLKNWTSLLRILLLFKKTKSVATSSNDNEQDQTVNALIKILNPLKLATQCLGNYESKIPTINMVCVVKHKLLNDLEALKGECEIFELIRDQLHQSILQNFIITDLHKIATFLDPRFKTMKFLSEKERRKTLELVKEQINIGNNPNSTEYVDKFYSDVENGQIINEINFYFNLPISKCFFKNQKYESENVVLEFWNKRRELPRLCGLAKKILSIPASANVEACKFSPEANELFKKRSLQMSEENDIDMADMINGNFHLVEFQ